MSTLSQPPSTGVQRARVAQRFIVFFVAWMAVVGGFFLWKARFAPAPKDLGSRLVSTNRRTQQEASIELAARMKQKGNDAAQWYPTLLKMAESPSAEQRGAAAWIMSSDTANEELHQSLLKLASDPSPAVRANAAVSLERRKDPAGHRVIVEMLQAAGASSDQQWEALRALKVVGTKEDLPLVQRFTASADARIRDAAKEALQGINDRD